jgi:hypothetical protein
MGYRHEGKRHETARFHQAARRRSGGIAARGTRADPGRQLAWLKLRENIMRNRLFLLTAVVTSLITTALQAGTPEEEKAFIEKYKTAFEAGDKATLQSFLYTENADPTVLEFYKMMQTDGAGQKIAKIELVDLSPEDVKKTASAMPGPGGQMIRLSLKPTKKLKITVETKSADGSSKSSSESFVAEKDGKYLIPVPVPAK